MTKKNTRYVALLTLFFMLIQVVPAKAVQKTANTMEAKILSENDPILSEDYINSFKANATKVENNGGQYIAKVDAAFDGNWNTYWQSGKQNNSSFKNEIIVTFDEITSISKMLYAVRQDVKDTVGYAKKVSLYISNTDNGDDFEKVATTVSETTEKKVQFTLGKAVQAKRVKFVFDETNRYWATASEIIFLKEDVISDILSNIFETSERYSLKAEYNSYDTIQNLEKMAENHPNNDDLMFYVNRAYKILNGEIDKENIPEKAMDFPVHTIQKTGPDNEKLVLVLMGEGYTKDEQYKFIEEITERVNNLLQIEPYKQYANEFNIYALNVESNESGIGRFESSLVSGIEKDTYFGIKHNFRGIDRANNFSGDGLHKARELTKQLEENYLDEGAIVFHNSILLNTDYYCGGGGEYSMASLGSDEFMVLHEAGHSFAGLSDEYYIGSNPMSDGPNSTTDNNPETLKWKEFLGFRGIDIYLNGVAFGGVNLYKPSNSSCIMEALEEDSFCEVCKHHTAKVFEEKLNKRDSYIADPIVTIEATGKEVTNDNIMDANDQVLKLRTIIENFTDINKNYTLRLSIENAQGQVKNTVENTFTIGGNTLKSVEVSTNVLSGITSTDKVVVNVVEGDRNLGNGKDYGRITAKYKLGNEHDETNVDISNLANRTIAVKAGTEYKVEAPELKGYVNTGVDTEASSILVEAGSDNKVTYYYAKVKGKVNLVLKNTNGQIIKSREMYLKYNTPFTPANNDFGRVNGYNVVAPNTTVTFDGVDELQTIEYTAVPTGEVTEKEVKVRAMSNGVVLGEISLGNKVAGTTIQVNAPTVAEIPALEGYRLVSEAVKTVALTNDANVQVVDFEFAENIVVQTPPTLTGVVDKTIKVEETFNKMAGVTAKDEFDNDITSSIVVTGSVDISRAGTYTLTYTATDSRGLQTTLSRTITVEEEPVVEGDTFDPTKVYNTDDIVIYKGVKYRAKYWTQGGTPDTSSAWEIVLQENPDGSKPYVPGMAYSTGDLVAYQGKIYKANWWTNTLPGSDSSWTLVG